MSPLQEQIKHARELAAREEYDEALAVVEGLCRTADAWPELLVLKGDLLQLTDDDRYSLADAENAYRQAIEMDPSCIEAYIELSEFYAHVLDDADRAQDIREQGTRAVLDVWKRLADTGPEEHSMKSLYYLALLSRLGTDKVSKVREMLAELVNIQEQEDRLLWPKWHESISREELEKARR